MVKVEYSSTQRYADILSDAGFKAVFGDKGNKEVLIGLLNVLLPEHRKVKDITYSTTEIEGLTMGMKRSGCPNAFHAILLWNIVRRSLETRQFQLYL